MTARDPDQALQALVAGNMRYVGTKLTHPNQTAERRMEVAKGQEPFAIIVGCADSRVPPEIIFDQGLGDLFVIRVGGHVVDDAALGSIEYAVEHLSNPLVMVLGHERCGAVEAAARGAEAPGRLGLVLRAIKPAVDKVKGQPGDLVENAVRANVEMVVGRLKAAQPLLAEWGEGRTGTHRWGAVRPGPRMGRSDRMIQERCPLPLAAGGGSQTRPLPP